MKNKLLAFLAAAAMTLSLAACGKTDNSSQTTPDSTNPVSDSTNSVSDSSQPTDWKETADGFYVDGTKLYDANGNEFVMRGINHAHTWFKDEKDTALEAIAATGANSVRIVLSDGGQWTKDDLASVKSLIEKCKELTMIAVLEVHDATGKDDTSSLEKACDYWIEMKDALIGNEKYVILNIANEWTGNWDSKLWRDGYTSVIPKIREAGIKNTILVDAGGWGQYGKSIADCGKEVFESDTLKNTMFAVHMYGTAGKNKKTIEKNLEGVTKQDLCVCVGEFGYTHSDGDVDEQYILDYCQKNGIGYLAWSWKGNGGGVEYLDLALEWDGSKLSSDWGETVVNGKNGIKETSSICSVFN